MPLRDDLLNPISGDNPSGVNLRYDRVYDQIKEARTEDDESIPSGDWQRQVKRADSALVIKLAGEALATKSKDLQLAAWLAEAHVKREGSALVQPCLKLFQDLQEQFWDTLFPEIEDGDAGMRAVPLEWAANRMTDFLREGPVTRDGLNFYQYKQSRSVGYEADAEASDTKRKAREEAIADGKVTGEDFDKSFAATPKSWYVQLDESFRSTAETLDALQAFCENRYGDDSPGFGRLRTSLEEVGNAVSVLLAEKRKLEPDAAVEEELNEAQAEPEPEPVADSEVETVAVQPAPRTRTVRALTAEPVDRDDAIARVQAAARFLQSQNAASPVAYMLQSALRFGEMREQGGWTSWDFLVPPPTETRQNLKRLAAEENWAELLSAAIAAVGEPCGRAWLDVHRYIWKASSEYGHSALAASVLSNVQGLLKDVPEIPTLTLSDDTPTANPETRRWLEEMVLPKPAEAVQEAEPEASSYIAPEPQREPAESAPPDVMDTARELLAHGHLSQAIQLLMRDSAQQPSGRARFLRRLQMAQLCVSAGQGKVAFPVLEELVKEIDQRQLEEWESSDMIAPPLALLLHCLEGSGDSGIREAVFARLCRVDPTAAIEAAR